MKTFSIGALVLLLSFKVWSQTETFNVKFGNLPNHTRINEFICPEGSLFSQIYPEHDNGMYCQENYYYHLATDDYFASSPFNNIRIWGGNYHGCTLNDVEMFEVYIWDSNPKLGGNLIYFKTLEGYTTPIDVMSYLQTPLYQIDIDLNGYVNELNGWIGITRKGPFCDEITGFGWCSFTSTGEGNSMSLGGTTWLETHTNFLFCMYSQNPLVPISFWSFMLGLTLIAIYMIIKFKLHSVYR